VTTPNKPPTKTNPPQKDYAWLERARQTFQELATNPDTAALEGIIAEGQARLAKVNPDDPLLAGYLRLTVAEAQFNLGLDLDDSVERQTMFAAGQHYCEQVAQEALVAGSGVACTLLPGVITLLAALYKAAPEKGDPGLADSLQSIAAQLDEALLYQAYEREKALERLQSARLLVVTMSELSLEDRRNVLTQAASQVIEAGELFVGAGDLEMVEKVQADLVEFEKSLSDPSLPTPRLTLFDTQVDEWDLLPELDGDDFEEDNGDILQSEALAVNPPSTRLAPAPTRKRRSALRWVISIGGLAASCLTMLCSGISLYTGLANRPATGEDVTIYLTQTAVSVEMTSLASGVTSPEAQQPTDTNPPATTPALGSSCPGAPASRLQVGEQATVGDVGGYSLTVYAEPGYESDEAYYLEEGDPFSIIGGPTCVKNQLWWEISRDQGHTGWVPESSETGDYLINP
jgi:hypothetical protein